jgi:phage terminase large subunit
MLDKTTYSWPPDYAGKLIWRQDMLRKMRANRSMFTRAKAYYARNPWDFTDDWVDTYDPRNATFVGRSVRMPFILFPRQRELMWFFQELLDQQVNGLVEKSRDMGATWDAGAFSVSKFLFTQGSAIGWGSRKEMLVDRNGDMDSIFEKLRYIVRTVPTEFYPPGFDPDNMSHMKIICAQSESSITGESGDDIGRGGRKSMYFKDESAHYERPEKIEAALADNTNVQVDISSVHGLNNVFHRRREAGTEWEPGERMLRNRANVFVMDWRQHPAKDEVWYREREQKARDEGLLHKFRQEVDRDYSASIEGTIVPLEWIKSCIDAHKKIEGMDVGPWMAALDVAGDSQGQGDRNAFTRRKGVVLNHASEWGDRDTTLTAQKAAVLAGEVRQPIKVQYDCIGVGEGVKGETNRLVSRGEMPKGVKFVAWDAGSGALYPERRVVTLDNGNEDPESPLNKDFYGNLKAQGWWMLRRRAEKTHNYITKGIRYPVNELMSIDSTIPKLRQLEKEIAQPTSKPSGTRLRLIVDKTPEGSRSPNFGDSTMMNFWPVDDTFGYDITMSGVG